MTQSLNLVAFDELYRDLSFDWLQDRRLRELIRAPEVSRENQMRWFESLSSRVDYLIWGVEFGGQPIGACGLKGIAPNSAEYWGYIAIEQFRARGLGRKMIAECERRALLRGVTQLRLQVWIGNVAAVAAYVSCGFERVRQDGDVFLMEKTL